MDHGRRTQHCRLSQPAFTYGVWLIAALLLPAAASAQTGAFPNVPADYFKEPPSIPLFWITSVDDVERFLDSVVKVGKLETIGTTAGGRRIRAVSYGNPRSGAGTTTFSGSLGFRDVRAFIGPDYAKKVYMAIAGVHGAEFEGIAGMANLISVLETGKDLRGKERPDLTAASKSVDRIVLVPIANPDGRARVPIRLEIFRGSDETVHEYLNTGGRPDGKIIGWPQCKEFIPLDFSKTQFPGGYPNDAGVNIQHDDFFGRSQPETQALLALAARERPDLILNLHTGAVYPLMHRPFTDPALMPAYDQLFRRVQGRLATEGLQETRNPAVEGNPSRWKEPFTYNLDTALSLHCGGLSVVIESPSHGCSTAKQNGKIRRFTPEDLVDTQLLLHLEAQKFLSETGGRTRWAPGRPEN
jgi:hypothetical protein